LLAERDLEIDIVKEALKKVVGLAAVGDVAGRARKAGKVK
jgi:hypothetical protein